MEMLIVSALLAIVIFIAAAMNSAEDEEERKERIKKRENGISTIAKDAEASGFIVSEKIYGLDHSYVLAVDEQNKKWLIGFPKNAQSKIYNFNDLISFDLIQNGNQIISGNDGKAAVGAVLFGAAGAVVGASAKKKVSDVCNDLHIEINVNDLDCPLIKLAFIDETMAVGSPLYETRSEFARKVMAILSYIKANAEQPAQKTLEQPQTDIYEEIEKLHNLKEKGILTEEEFTQKKKSLLGI